VWWLALYSGIAGTALSNVGWYFAINRVGQSRASPYLYLLPIFGVGFSAALLGEPLGWWHLVGLVLVIVGTRLGSAARAVPAASA
jgi:drug/metabolite transporter (DMT)-like permease